MLAPHGCRAATHLFARTVRADTAVRVFEEPPQMAADTSLADADYPKPRAALPGSGAMRLRITHRGLAATTPMLTEDCAPQAPLSR